MSFILNYPDLACAEINFSHPLALGLERCLVAEGLALRDLVYNERFDPTGSPIVSSLQQGCGTRNNSTTGANYWSVPFKSETKDSFSLFSFFRPETNNATSVNNHIIRDSASNSCALGYAGGGATRWSARVGGTTITYAVTPTTGVHYTEAVTSGGGSSALYVDGVSRATGSAGANAATSPWVIGKNGTSSNGPDASFFLTLIYSRPLSAGEIILLHLDPFALFRRKPSFLYTLYYTVSALTLTVTSATLTLSPQSYSLSFEILRSITATTLSLLEQSYSISFLRTLTVNFTTITLSRFSVLVTTSGGAVAKAFIKLGHWLGVRF